MIIDKVPRFQIGDMVAYSSSRLPFDGSFDFAIAKIESPISMPAFSSWFYNIEAFGTVSLTAILQVKMKYIKPYSIHIMEDNLIEASQFLEELYRTTETTRENILKISDILLESKTVKFTEYSEDIEFIKKIY